jgi:hypothetical protein
MSTPPDRIDLPAWCFTLPDEEYQGCSPAHVATGAITSGEGQRMAINVELIGGTPMVRHFVEVSPRSTTLFSNPYLTFSLPLVAPRST